MVGNKPNAPAAIRGVGRDLAVKVRCDLDSRTGAGVQEA